MQSYELGACPACGESNHAVLADADEIKEELELLWRFHLARQKTGVPTEHLHDRTFFTQDPPLQLVECKGCGTVYRNPRESGRALIESYAGEAADAAVYQALFEAHQRSYRTQARMLTDVMGAAGDGIEVGSYVGGFLAAAREVGWRFAGVDVNEQTNAFTRGLGFTVMDGALQDVPDGRQYDAVAIWNCFDQLAAPRATAQRAAELLKPGGVLVVRVPNGACYARYRPAALRGGPARRLLAYNNLLGFPYRQGFTPSSLQAMLRRLGYQIVRVRRDVLVPVTDRWTRTWARVEAQVVNAATRVWPPRRFAPWFEVYCRLVT
jgi:SAM-dependent methyltransferase